jgi:hypothetical protein
MADITHLHPKTSGGALTSAHRQLMAAIQTTCIDVSLTSPDVTACCHYSGSTHEVYITVYWRDTHTMVWSGNVYLPGGRTSLDTSNALAELGDLLEHLQRYLPNAGGAA